MDIIEISVGSHFDLFIIYLADAFTHHLFMYSFVLTVFGCSSSFNSRGKRGFPETSFDF